MPRTTRSRRASLWGTEADTDTIDPTDSETTETLTDSETNVTSAVDTYDDQDQDAQFDLSIEEAPADYSPDRRTPGRQRRPSYFDEKLRAPDVFGGPWQRVPFTSEEHKAYILRELNRAKLYLNGTGKQEGDPEIGLDLDDKKEDAVYFKSRVAQKRERKNPGTDALTENAQEDGTYDVNGDNDR